jgi:hypothetical protein
MKEIRGFRIMPLSYQLKTYVKFNINKLNSLQTYDISQNYTILHKVVQLLSQHNFKISNHRHTQKLLQKNNTDSNKTSRYVHDLHCTKRDLSDKKCNVSWGDFIK